MRKIYLQLKTFKTKLYFTSYYGQSFNSTDETTKENMTFNRSKRIMQEDTKSSEDHELQNVEFEIKK